MVCVRVSMCVSTRGCVQMQLIRRNVKRLRGGLVFKAHRLVYHSTLGWRVIKRIRSPNVGSVHAQPHVSGAYVQRECVCERERGERREREREREEREEEREREKASEREALTCVYIYIEREREIESE